MNRPAADRPPAPARAPAWAVFFDGPAAYDRGVRLQEAVHAARVRGAIPDTVLFLEHAPVVTLGRRGRDRHLRLDAAALAARGIALHRASRGGDVTYHGPGQWVVYPILRLGGAEADSHGYLWNLEEIAIRAAADFGVRAFRRPGKSGAWAEGGKFAAIGFFLRRWVTLHGMSFNVDVDLAGFETIVPCGLTGERVASLATLLGPAACPPRAVARDALLRHFAAVLGRDVTLFRSPADAPPALRKLLPAA